MDGIRRMRERLSREAEDMLGRSLKDVDVREAGMVCDMLKDLAEAERDCAEAEYYESVVDSMGAYGDRSGYTQQYEVGDRMGYRNSRGQYARDPNRRRMRSGYSEESVENLRRIMDGADPARREQLKKDLQDLMSEM